MRWKPIFYFQATGDGLIIYNVEHARVVEANHAAAAMHGYSHEQFVGLHSAAFIHPDSQHQFHEHIRAVQSGDAFEALAIHMRREDGQDDGKNGLPFTVEVRGTAFTYQDRLCLLSIIHEVGGRNQTGQSLRTEQSLRQQMEVRLGQQARFLETSQMLTTELELKPGMTLDELRVIYEQVQMLTALEERKRLAQNLHDAVNQSLFSASLITEVLPRLWERHPEQIRESLEDLRRLTRGALAEMRGLLVELQPLALIDRELEDLLRFLGDALTGRTNMPPRLVICETIRELLPLFPPAQAVG